MYTNTLGMFIPRFGEIENLTFYILTFDVLDLETCHFSSDFGTFSGRVRMFPDLKIRVELSQGEASWSS